jgi:hypothetical protein
MGPNRFRKLALAFEGAVEGAHMGHPDFRVNNRIFATLHADDITGMVALTPEQQQEFMADHPEMFTPAAGAWGRGGSTLVRLPSADEETLGQALTLAWQNAVQKTRAKQATRKRASSTVRKPSKR